MTAHQQATPTAQEIYRQLQHGTGHQWVTDDNVRELIDMATARGDRLVEVELREWQAPHAPNVDVQEILHGTHRPGKPLSP